MRTPPPTPSARRSTRRSFSASPGFATSIEVAVGDPSMFAAMRPRASNVTVVAPSGTITSCGCADTSSAARAWITPRQSPGSSTSGVPASTMFEHPTSQEEVAPSVTTNWTMRLRRMASTRANCRPFKTDSAEVRVWALPIQLVNAGTACEYRIAATASTTASSTTVKPPCLALVAALIVSPSAWLRPPEGSPISQADRSSHGHSPG